MSAWCLIMIIASGLSSSPFPAEVCFRFPIVLGQSNLKDLIVVVQGEEAALRVGAWISGAYVDRLHVEVPTGEVLKFGADNFINFEKAGVKEARKLICSCRWWTWGMSWI